MGKNKGKGGKGHRRGKGSTGDPGTRALVTKKDGQDYALVTKMLGNRRIRVLCNDGRERLAIIPGKFKRRIWVNQGDLVLLNIRDYQEDKADVSYVYNGPEARRLEKMGEITNALAGKGEHSDLGVVWVTQDDVDQSFVFESEQALNIDNL